MFWSLCLLEGIHTSSSCCIFSFVRKKCPGFELIDVLKLSTKAQLAFHKIILLMCDILSCSFLKFSFLYNYLGQMWLCGTTWQDCCLVMTSFVKQIETSGSWRSLVHYSECRTSFRIWQYLEKCRKVNLMMQMSS